MPGKIKEGTDIHAGHDAKIADIINRGGIRLLGVKNLKEVVVMVHLVIRQ